MAYQNVGTPRFYVNILQYLKVIGLVDTDDSVYDLNPTRLHNAGERVLDDANVPDEVFNDKAYVAFLGHQGGQLNLNHNYTSDISVNANISITNGTGNGLDPEYEGFSIASFNGDSVIALGTYTQYKIGSIVIGNYYDMPHSPDLNLKLTYEYDGVKTIQTKGGATLSNASYTKPADWGSAGAWQLGTNTSNLRSGRRVWDLSFSYLSDTDVFPVNASQSLAAFTGDGYHTDTDNPTSGFVDINTGSVNGGTAGEFNSNILDSTDFFSQVWNRTMGGHLPFIFQPDGSNNNPDQFAICRFDMKSLTYDQVANNVYNVKLKIRECW